VKSRATLNGFTLIELMMVLLVFSCLSMVAVPSYIDFQERQTTSIKAQEVKRMLEFARNIAITRNKEVKVCLVTSDYRCTQSQGNRLVLFHDKNFNHQWNVSEQKYRDISIESLALKLSVSGGRRYIRFKQTGESKESGNILVCDKKAGSDYGRQVIVFRSGQIRLSKGDDLDGYDDKSGHSILCH
jgi:type IV fimbrial biogenesis protein FimT